MSRGQAQPRNQSVRRVLERCKTRGTIEIIDVDKEPEDVVIVDVEETSHQESRGPGTTRRNCFPDGVISIDDDDGDADDMNVHADATSKEFHPASSNSSKSEELKGDECSMTSRKEKLPFESMEYMRKRKHCHVGPSVNQFGLGCSSGSWSDNDRSEFVSESSISASVGSDSDSSDCEIMEDSGYIREQWERAALRKRVSYRHPFGLGDQTGASGSGSSGDNRFSNGEESRSRIDIETCLNKIYSNQFKEIPSECCPNNLSSGKENLSFNIPATAKLGEPFCKRNVNTADSDVDPATNTCHKEPKHVSETCGDRAQSPYKNHSDNLRSDFRNPETVLFSSVCHLNMQRDPKVDDDDDDDDVSSSGEDEQVPTATTYCANGYNGESSYSGKVESHRGKSFLCNPQSQDGEQLRPDSTIQDKGKHLHEQPSFSMQPQYEYVVRETAGCRVKEKPSLDQQPSCNYHCSDSPLLTRNGEPTHKEFPNFNTNGGSGTPGRSVSFDPGLKHKPEEQSFLIFERERHKESDEYRRAEEEEWAARQHQLQIQAEEAQKLKRRRKAETLRLLDMERRQKQRLKEIRESQKKVEETTNLKEHLRAEVRKELETMELRYRDMAFPLPCHVTLMLPIDKLC
ncbi:uncharacterized protein A4U43_C06F19930 [Asparagus officinalis]|uniref:Uncharacterized protein n=1 Tax=Asparagus officinalis TaxID=4686 RepID=A0A5P1ERQ3_ASPOF|nr:uncharacterized protein A4U43_C06F19930 [Asparagus officinalis]